MPVIETKGAASSGGFGQFAQRAEGAYIEDVFSTYLYAGNGSTQTITNGINLLGKNGMVWLKSRSSSDDTGGGSPPGYGHGLFDTLRGRTKVLRSETTAAELVYPNAISSFNTTGFSFGDATYNFSNQNFVSWTFRKQAKFFDIVTYIGNGSSSRLINHSLGSAPGLVIIKATSTTSNWPVMFAPTSGNAYGFSNGFAGGGLNTNGAGYSLGSVSGVSTETQFRVGSSYWGAGSETNDSGVTYIAYVFANNAGGFGASGTENAITCGTYTGNGSTTGPIITLGYEPQFLLIKNRESGTYEDWVMVDTMRGLPVNGPAALLYADLANSEASTNPFINVSATGFQPVVSSSRINASGNNYMYMAIRRGPMRTPTSGTSVYGAATGYSSDYTNVATGILVDAGLQTWRNTATDGQNLLSSRLTGARLQTSSTAAETGAGAPKFDSMNGYTPYYANNVSGLNPIAWTFRRAPGFFDVVCYTGNGTTLTANHNLGVVPEMMIIKRRDTSGNWSVYTATTGVNKVIELNSAYGAQTASYWGTGPTATTFQVQSNVNTGNRFVAYLFASCPGVSKVGSYTGTGTTQQINCGFTGGARFVLIKRTDDNSSGTANWFVWDSARGIVAGNDPYLLLNSSAAEVTSTDYIDTLSTGFEISSTAPAAINANGGSYIFLAIA